LQVGELGQLVKKVLVFLEPGFQMGGDVLRRSKGRPNGDKAPSGWLAIAAPNRWPQVSQVGRGCLRQRPIDACLALVGADPGVGCDRAGDGVVGTARFWRGTKDVEVIQEGGQGGGGRQHLRRCCKGAVLG
jgi:hypothetical protein